MPQGLMPGQTHVHAFAPPHTICLEGLHSQLCSVCNRPSVNAYLWVCKPDYAIGACKVITAISGRQLKRIFGLAVPSPRFV